MQAGLQAYSSGSFTTFWLNFLVPDLFFASKKDFYQFEMPSTIVPIGFESGLRMCLI
jgi:hypothetical protein